MALSDFGNALFWLGILVAIAGGALGIYLARRSSPHHAAIYGGGTMLGGVLLLVSGYLVLTLAVSPAAVAPPPAGGAITTTLSGGSVGSAGVSWSAASSILTVDLVYNYSSTANYFCVEASNATCGPTAGHTSTWPNYLYLPFTMARTDPSNVTYGFTATVRSVPTYTTVGGSATAYSFVGYKPASGTSNGQWQVKWTTGSLAGQFPSGSAPSVTSNLISTLEGIKGFGSATAGLQVSLPGGNSTSAPLSGSTPALFSGTTIQQFVAYPMTLTFGSSNPGTITINFIVIGQHA
jgi:hypothetical protein